MPQVSMWTRTRTTSCAHGTNQTKWANRRVPVEKTFLLGRFSRLSSTYDGRSPTWVPDAIFPRTAC